ncbi:hypothetical protein JCM8208_006132 [Rhodotorula glutinis]
MSSYSDASSNAAAGSSTSGRPQPSPSTSTDNDRNKRSHSVGSSAAADGRAGGATKRKKTLRACDNCRVKRLKCEFIPDRPYEAPQCYECDKRKLPCELVKPAQMDARKAVKLGLAAPKPPRGSAPSGPSVVVEQPPPPIPGADASRLPPGSTDGLDMLARCVDRVEDQGETPRYSPHSFSEAPPIGELHVAQLLADLYPPHDSQTVDSRVVQRWTREGGCVRQTPDWGPGIVPETRLTSQIVLALLDHFVDHILPVWPVITVAEIRSYDTLSPITLFSICIIAGVSRPWPRIIFDTARGYWETVLKTSDVFITSSLANLQAILIMTLSSEPHGPTASAASSALFLRTATAIRMAHDLGLHRPPPPNLPKAELDTRMRLWTCTVCLDRWYSAAFGQPALLDLEGCHDYFSAPDLPHNPYLINLYRLSELLYRATRAVDRTRLSTTTTDEQLEAILRDFDAWAAQLPPALQFAGPDSSRKGGWMHALHVAFESIFFHEFVRPKSRLPERLHFRPTPARWFAAVTRSSLAIDWILYHGVELLDSTMLASFSLMMANSVQYIACAKAGQFAPGQALGTVQDRLEAWVDASEDRPPRTRRAMYKVALLMVAAVQRQCWSEGSGAASSRGPAAVPVASAVEPDLAQLNETTAPSTSTDPLGPLPLQRSSLVADSHDVKPAAASSASSDEHVNEWQRWINALASGELDVLDRELWAQLPDVA